MEKIRKILYLVPDAIFRNYNDEVVEWLDARSQPTQAQINAVTDQQVLDSEADNDADNALSRSRKDKLIFEINFDIENRLRVLEGKSAVTKPQYKTALINQYKGL
jgi:hypothetical protein